MYVSQTKHSVETLNLETYTQTSRVSSALSDNDYFCKCLSCVHILTLIQLYTY